MFDAWDVTLNGFLIPLLSKEWGLTPGQAAWIGTANLIGMAVGAFAWGSIADIIGRKKAFTLTLLIFSIFTVLGAFSNDIVLFCVFRFMAGFGLGGCIPVDYALVGEFTPRKHRGRVLTAMDAWWPIGASLCGVVSAVLMASLRQLALPDAGHGAAGPAGVLGARGRPGIAAVPGAGRAARGSQEGHRDADRAHGRHGGAVETARSGGRTQAVAGQGHRSAGRAVALQLAHHRHCLVPVPDHPAGVLRRPDVDAVHPGGHRLCAKTRRSWPRPP